MDAGRRRMLRLVWALAAACGGAGVAAGGGVGIAADGGAGVDRDATIWPSRWGDDAAGKGVIVPVDGPLDAWSPRRHGRWHRRLPRGADERIVESLAEGRVGPAGYRFRLEGPGAFVFERDPGEPAPDRIGRSDPAFMFVFASGQVAASDSVIDAAGGNGADGPHVDIERTWFAYYDHRTDGLPAGDEPGLGTVMLLPGLFGVPEGVIDVMVSTFRTRGWNVIRMLAPPSRLVEFAEIELDTDDEASPAEIAELLTDRMAETAYAAEAALDHVFSRRPALTRLPAVIVGGSMGALSLPGAVMRDPGAYDAAVIIAGGANMLDVVTRSTYTEPVEALAFDWVSEAGEPDEATRRAFVEAYLEHAPLDGYHAKAAFEGVPVLMLEASGDRAVPVAASRLLWSRLGEPERWEIQSNHIGLFLTLWLYTPRVLDWLDEHAVDVDP